MKEEEKKYSIIDRLPPMERRGWPWDEESIPPQGQWKLEELPVITIVTPTLNQGNFIEETIRSILLQNYPRLEYIILDGGSTDNTLDIISKYETWISHWESKKDNGQAAVIQEGFERSIGDYLGWINSDDLLCKNALWHFAHFVLENENPDFIYGNAYILSEDGKWFSFQPQKENISLQAIGSFPFVQPACFFRSSYLEKVGPIDADLNITFDYELFARMVLAGAVLQFIPADIAIFRRQPNAKTYKYNASWDADRIETFSRILRTIEVEDSLLKPLKQIGTYKPGVVKYSYSSSYNKGQKHRIIAYFILDNIRFYYADMRDFKLAFQNAQFLQIHLPEYFSKTARLYFYRSKLFKSMPFIHEFWRTFYSLLIRILPKNY